MKVGDLIQTTPFGMNSTDRVSGIIVGIVKDAHPRITCFEVLMSVGGDIITRWEGDLEAAS